MLHRNVTSADVTAIRQAVDHACEAALPYEFGKNLLRASIDNLV
jgi:hypothetical protein